MLLMLAVVACYTICSLSDKYAVSKLKMNGSTLTFIMAAATAFFMLAYLPFDSRYFDGSLTAYLAILLMAASKFLEFQLAAVVLKEMSAFELKAWLGLTVFLSYGTDLILGSAALGAVTAWKFGFIAVTVHDSPLRQVRRENKLREDSASAGGVPAVQVRIWADSHVY